mmetsp:Transcript_79859/g.171152  ORF Transcript_79859/g.171152 Transcript_79859/m.171152 type:complete len:236 (+) Transcript_79859:971-1678(+)
MFGHLGLTHGLVFQMTFPHLRSLLLLYLLEILNSLLHRLPLSLLRAHRSQIRIGVLSKLNVKSIFLILHHLAPSKHIRLSEALGLGILSLENARPLGASPGLHLIGALAARSHEPCRKFRLLLGTFEADAPVSWCRRWSPRRARALQVQLSRRSATTGNNSRRGQGARSSLASDTKIDATTIISAALGLLDSMLPFKCTSDRLSGRPCRRHMDGPATRRSRARPAPWELRLGGTR